MRKLGKFQPFRTHIVTSGLSIIFTLLLMCTSMISSHSNPFFLWKNILFVPYLGKKMWFSLIVCGEWCTTWHAVCHQVLSIIFTLLFEYTSIICYHSNQIILIKTRTVSPILGENMLFSLIVYGEWCTIWHAVCHQVLSIMFTLLFEYTSIICYHSNQPILIKTHTVSPI